MPERRQRAGIMVDATADILFRHGVLGSRGGRDVDVICVGRLEMYRGARLILRYSYSYFCLVACEALTHKNRQPSGSLFFVSMLARFIKI